MRWELLAQAQGGLLNTYSEAWKGKSILPISQREEKNRFRR